MRRKKNKEYYAVLEGHRLAQPTIYSSWAKAHVRTTGHSSERDVLFQGFHTLQAAEMFKLENCGGLYRIDIKSGNEQTTPKTNGPVYHAVANGHNLGIYKGPYSVGGAEREVSGESHSCHKSFRSKEQAEEFIDDCWKCYLDILVEATAERLQAGWRPSSSRLASFDVGLVPPTPTPGDNVTDLADTLGSLNV